jgi:hypothetical protein
LGLLSRFPFLGIAQRVIISVFRAGSSAICVGILCFLLQVLGFLCSLWWFWGFEEVVGGFVNLVLEGASFFFFFFSILLVCGSSDNCVVLVNLRF